MPPHEMATRLANLFAADPQLAFDFFLAASEVVDDFEEWGPVLQANEDSSYDDSTAIVTLQRLRNEIIARERAASP